MGIRAIQIILQRLKDRLLYEEHGKQKRIVVWLLFLFNLLVKLVSINQIETVYMNYLNEVANVEFSYMGVVNLFLSYLSF